MSRRHDVQDATGRVEYLSGRGTLEAWGTGAPTSGAPGFAPGCIYHRVDGGVSTALYVNEGTFSSATWVALGSGVIPTAGVIGVGSGYKIARGVAALDGSNPTPVTTGLTTVVAATVTLEGTAAPGVGTSVLTIASTNYATGALAVYAWKVTSSSDTTLVASTGTENFEWVAVGT